MVSALIVWNIFSEAAEFFNADEFSWSSLQGIGWFPRRGIFDVWTLFIGTLWITGIAIALAGPVGLGVAFYLSEYASPRVRQIIKPIIETLASIPSVVLGLFALSFITPQVLQPLDDSIGVCVVACRRSGSRDPDRADHRFHLGGRHAGGSK